MSYEYQTLVWVSKPDIKEVDGEQGFVEVTGTLAEKLIAEGKAQDTRDGALHLEEIQEASAPKKGPSKKRRKSISKDDLETVAIDDDSDGE